MKKGWKREVKEILKGAFNYSGTSFAVEFYLNEENDILEIKCTGKKEDSLFLIHVAEIEKIEKWVCGRLKFISMMNNSIKLTFFVLIRI